MRRAGETLVAPAARTAPGHHRSLAGPDEVEPGPVGLHEHLGPGWDGDLERLTVAPVALGALAVGAPPGFEV